MTTAEAIEFLQSQGFQIHAPIDCPEAEWYLEQARCHQMVTGRSFCEAEPYDPSIEY